MIRDAGCICEKSIGKQNSLLNKIIIIVMFIEYHPHQLQEWNHNKKRHIHTRAQNYLLYVL